MASSRILHGLLPEEEEEEEEEGAHTW